MLKELKNILSEEQINIQNSVRSCIPTAVFGFTLGNKARIASMFNKVCYIAPDLISARQIALDLELLSDSSFVILPPKNDVLLLKSAINKDILRERILAFHKILNKNASFVTTIEALMQLAPKKINFLTIKQGDTISITELIDKLISLGYKRVDYIQSIGEFSIRGDVFDIYPINATTSYSIDFFYDEIEKIREFDIETSKKDLQLNEIEIVQTSEFFLPDENIDDISKKILSSVSTHQISSAKQKLLNYSYELIDQLKIGGNDKLNALLPLFNCMDLLPKSLKDYVVIYDEGKLISERASGLIKEHNERFINLYRNGETFNFAISQFALPEVVFSLLNNNKTLSMQNLTSIVSFYNPLKIFRINSSPVINYSLRPNGLEEDCKDWFNLGYRVLLCAGDNARAGKLAERLSSSLVPYKFITNNNDFSGVCITNEYLGKGFIEHDNKLVVIATPEIFITATKNKSLKTKKYSPFVAPQVGDYAVHEKFGIGRVVGNKRISTTDGTKDYLEVEYKGGDRLYVSVDHLDRLSKYLGADEPKLNKIGGEFEKIKEKIKQSISEMSINLKKLYKARKEKIGYKYSEDNEYTLQFDNAFEFEPTEDQLYAIQEIKSDMESNKIMDRLICGDVGFGKTEVAMRACFKAYLDCKQVAVVAPTTILTQQHFLTFSKRFKAFGAKIEVINRFKTQTQKAKILSRLASGDIDIIIGTHALFGKNVKFADLGLLVLDEEQRFGVEHKEKIKTMKENVDTLTLTATPIPRTLHMSLVGIRDISEINTPPQQRIPTQTFVLAQTDAVIEDAIKRELDRDGQVFILYNKVETILDFASKIEKLVPEGKILVAHGQMPERILEDKIISFFNGEFNVLIATTIIENGIDLPNANTIIVIDADKLGLSTLYQLRGRVGRSNKMAYAYFTYKQQVLNDSAYKRLNALMEYSEIGSGYKIALRDLEIRGAGNVLGKEQHGHMEKIGYELYSKLLKEKLINDNYERECEIDCKISSYLPDDYVEYPSARMECYKKISQISSYEEKISLENEMIKAFGNIPQETQNLLEIAYLKVLCKEIGVVKATISKMQARLELNGIECLKNEKIINKLNQNTSYVALTVEDKPVLIFDKKVEEAKDRLAQVINFLK